MIISIFKTFFILSAFFLVLCITIKDKPVFSYVYDVVSPATRYVQGEAANLLNRSVTTTQSYSKQLFDNSLPKVKDRVGLTQASHKKSAGIPNERITDQEKAELNDLIKGH